ncbi:hypothetical protein ACFL2M_00970 [Patescibacteria group bacterium]
MNRAFILIAVLFLVGVFAVLIFVQPFDLGQEPTSYTTSLAVGLSEVNSWNSERVTSPSVLYDQTSRKFKMWYVGNGVFSRSGIGYAESSDGVSWNYDSFPDPVLEPPAVDPNRLNNLTWESGGIRSVSVVKSGSLYHMWYSAEEYSDQAMQQIGYATSKDGLIWAKQAANPVLGVGVAGSWEGHSVGQPFVLREGSEFKMWYTGWRADDNGEPMLPSIGFATSKNGTTWEKQFNRPVVAGSAEGWNEDGVAAPHVISVRAGQLYEMWMHGIDKKGHTTIGRAYSDDGLRWAEDEGSPVVEDDDYEFSEPDVSKADDMYYLLFERKEEGRRNYDNIHFSAWPLTVENNVLQMPGYIPANAL